MNAVSVVVLVCACSWTTLLVGFLLGCEWMAHRWPVLPPPPARTLYVEVFLDAQGYERGRRELAAGEARLN